MKVLTDPAAGDPRRRARRVLTVRPAHGPGLWWAARALRRSRRELDTAGTRLSLDVPGAMARRLPVPVLEAYLRWRCATCLERAVVVQHFLRARAEPYDVVIGIRKSDAPGGAVTAHAWLEGWDVDSAGAGYREITRIAG